MTVACVSHPEGQKVPQSNGDIALASSGATLGLWNVGAELQVRHHPGPEVLCGDNTRVNPLTADISQVNSVDHPAGFTAPAEVM